MQASGYLSNKTNKYESAYTLVELSVVIVIVGLLAAGVLQGQELVAQAKIRRMVHQIQEVDTAKNAFITQYDGIPGDFPKASSFSLDANTADTEDPAHEGNNDGKLEDADGDFLNFTGEIMNFWIHLSNAELLEGSYAQRSGCAASGTGCDYSIGVAYPNTPIGNGIVALSADGGIEYVTGLAVLGSTGTDLIGATLTPQQAYSIDSKLDDGLPEEGRVKAIVGYSDVTSGEFTNDTATSGGCFAVSGTYNVSADVQLCTIRIRSVSN